MYSGFSSSAPFCSTTNELRHSHANQSMALQMNGSRILDSGDILNTTHEREYDLIKVGDKYRLRLVANTGFTQSAGALEQRPVVSRENTFKHHYSFAITINESWHCD